jgi:hypothetical protein
VTTKSQGPLMQSSHRSTQMVSIASLHKQAESYKSTNATTCLFCLKCKLPFGAWITLAPIYEEEIYARYGPPTSRKTGQSAYKDIK